MCIKPAFILLIALLVPAPAGAETRAIDVERSAVTIRVEKAGLFAAFADNHQIRAPIARGSIVDADPAAVEFVIESRRLTVLDPALSTAKRQEVQARMVGPDVLDADRFPSIQFRSTAIAASGPGRWRVTGDLTLHGVTRSIVVDVSLHDRRYAGTALLKQRDFGITPITIAGGAVKVKNEIEIAFDIVPL
jgi:polyisoprenoid-binding protein YceI